MVGWWSLYSVEILNSVDNMRAEKKDKQMEYDKDSAEESAIIPPALKDADSWEKISITFSKDAFKDYTYDTVLSAKNPYGYGAGPIFPVTGKSTIYGTGRQTILRTR